MPSRETRDYRAWIKRRVEERAAEYEGAVTPGLLSILTPVWDGSPLAARRELAGSIAQQNQRGATEWVVLDNGCQKAGLRSYLATLSEHPWVQLVRSEANVGILQGLRMGLDNARGRYVLPVDGDDLLYADALRIVAAAITREGYPPLLYTDEDKLIGGRVYQPYLKPDWDPVLLLNSAYIAHLGVMDREWSHELGVYSDRETEGSPDWDAFVRFLIAGCPAVHIPEVVYSWRVHAASTADDAASKPYVHASQRAVLQRFLDAQAEPDDFSVEYSPLFGGAPHWRFMRRVGAAPAFATVTLRRNATVTVGAHPRELEALARDLAGRDGFIHLIGEDVDIEERGWERDAWCLFALHPDAVMIGGPIWNRRGTLSDAGRCFGFAGVCGSPYRGALAAAPGYFAEAWKQRSVSAVSTQFAVVRASFLLDLLSGLPESASLGFLGAWVGAHAMRTGKRIVYSPFLSGISDVDWDEFAGEAERQLFAEKNRDIIPDHRFYSRHFSLQKPFALVDS